MDLPSEKDLVDRARLGERDAFDTLAARHRDRFEALVRSRLGHELANWIAVQDVIQESLLRALKSIASYRGEDSESFLRWLGGIANHVVLEAARRQRRDVIVALGDELGDTDAASPSHAGRREERFERLQAALDSLPEDQRRVIWLARIERLPIRDVAERLERSPAATSQLLWRALKKLKESFGSTDSFRLPPRELRQRVERAEGEGDGPRE